MKTVMKDLTKIFVDLSKCTEEEQKHIISLLPKAEFDNQYRIDDCHFRLSFDGTDLWWVYNDKKDVNKTEISYPEFVKLFEGRDGENEGWIKIGDDGKIFYNGALWGIDKHGYMSLFSEGQFIEKGILEYYYPIIKPEPPKF